MTVLLLILAAGIGVQAGWALMPVIALAAAAVALIRKEESQ